MSLKGVFIKCKNCGRRKYKYPRDIRKNNTGNFYCSRKCFIEDRSTLSIIKCKYCGKERTYPKWEAKKRKYCCHKCSTRDHNTPIYKIKCEECGKIFICDMYDHRRRRFCSRICYWKYLFIGSGQRNFSELNNWVFVVKSRDNWKCCACGKVVNLVSHHILPYSVFNDQRTNIKNGITMCESCHRKLHSLLKISSNRDKPACWFINESYNWLTNNGYRSRTAFKYCK